jgi:DNA-binding transcriptional LysR family regulator
MSTDLDLRGLREFVAVARAKSITAAAYELGLTKSAVGKKLAILEQRLGVRLLHRTTRKISLTVEGEAYFAVCVRALEEFNEVEDSFTASRSSPSGRLRIDLPGAFGRIHVMPILAELAAKHPKLRLSVSLDDRKIDILEEGVDLALRLGRAPDSLGLVARVIGVQRPVICASPSYLKTHGIPLTIDDLAQHICIFGLARQIQSSWIFRDGEGRTYHREIPVGHEVSDGESMLTAALAGCGLVQLPTWLLGDHLETGRLKTVLDEDSSAEMPITVIWPAKRSAIPRVRIVLDALIEFVNSNQTIAV